MLRRLGEAAGYLSANLPLPNIKPCEGVRRILAFGNLRYLFRTTSILSDRQQIARYHPDDGCRVVTPDEFWGDRVDNREFGREYDFSRPFFEQFEDLVRSVLHLPLSAVQCEGCDWINGGSQCRDCYLCFSVIESRDCMYCMNQYYGHDNVDCVGTQRSEFCYSCLDIDQCYECQHCQDCSGCSNCIACFDCRACSDCIGCIGLDHARFCAFGRQMREPEYRDYLAKLNLSSYLARSALLGEWLSRLKQSSHKPRRNIAVENSSGAYNRRSKNLVHCYFAAECEDCGFEMVSLRSRDCWKGYAGNSELVYSSGVVDGHAIGYSYGIWNGSHLWYCYHTFAGSSYCFGCAELKKNSYCILNKQYSKAEYFDLVPRIVAHMRSTGEWGLFFPPRISPHPFRESFASDFVEDLPDETIASRGYRTRLSADTQTVSVAHRLAVSLPDDIREVSSSLKSELICCEDSKHPFNFQEKEINFYRRFSIPLPHLCWRDRIKRLLFHRERMTENLDVIQGQEGR